jgi:hypothetical protein
MPINYAANVRSLRDLVERLDTPRLAIPDHQRDFVWTPRQQKRLVSAIRRGKPIPSVLLRELDDGRMTLEDGHQRLRSLRRFCDNEFSDENDRLFRDYSEVEQALFLNYNLVTVTYSGATDEQAREIFNDYQNGRPLTIGERLYSLKLTSPIIRYAIRMLLTPGQGFHDRLANTLGGDRTAKGKRGADLMNAYALCAGLAFGIDHLSKKWDDAELILHLDFDEASTTARLETYVRIWERVDALAPVTTKARRNMYWHHGNFGGYIAYSVLLMGTPLAAEFDLPATTPELVEAWAQHIAEEYRDPDLLLRVLHRDIPEMGRAWKQARWANGLRRLFTPDVDEVAVVDDTEDEADTDD